MTDDLNVFNKFVVESTKDIYNWQLKYIAGLYFNTEKGY